jgi:hypothetical protein
MESIKRMLPDQMSLLKQAADQCLEAGKEIDDEFSQWLDMVGELHRATVERLGTTEEESRMARLDLASKEVQVTWATDQQKMASESVTTLKSTLEITQAAFKKASESYPSGKPFSSRPIFLLHLPTWK